MISLRSHYRALVVAPPGPFRNAVLFLISVEGLVTAETDAWPPGQDTDGFHCVVVDETAIAKDTDAYADLATLGRRLVFLHSNTWETHGLDEAALVLKPPLARALIDAVVHAARYTARPPELRN